MIDFDAAALAQRLENAQIFAHSAGAGLMKHMGRLAGFETKASASDLVTVADQEADEQLRALVETHYPGDGMISEEADGVDGLDTHRERAQKSEFTWCIDPLDGTTNFVHGYPKFAVSIGLLFRGQVVGGVIHAPALEETFMGGLGISSCLNGKEIHVSREPAMTRGLIATGFPKAPGVDLRQLLDTLHGVLRSCHGIRRAGSAALDLCDLACGRIDGYYEWGLSPWDVTAGQAIVEAAGGRVTNSAGGPHDPFGKSILATNDGIHVQMVGLLRENSVVNPTGDGRHD